MCFEFLCGRAFILLDEELLELFHVISRHAVRAAGVVWFSLPARIALHPQFHLLPLSLCERLLNEM